MTPKQFASQIQERSLRRCERCSGLSAHSHHRRRRAIKDEHQHCYCNGVALCLKCHDWAHRNPTDAMAQGFIVSVWIDTPGRFPVKTWRGWALLHCDGSYTDTAPLSEPPLTVPEGLVD